MMQPLERDIVSDLDDKTDDAAPAGRRRPLHVRILIGLALGAVAGGGARIAFGTDAPALTWLVTQVTEPVGQLFLRLLLMTVVPLVFTSLVAGVAGIGDVRRLGRVGIKCLVYTLVVSVISVAIGLGLANSIRPGARIDPATRESLMARFSSEATRQTQATASSTTAPLMTLVQTVVPANPLESAARSTPDMIAIMFFALMFGIALTLVRPETANRSLRCSRGSSRSSPKSWPSC
jgi:DAACS family dicarboxylate/amino acid:cation (Na+ or H+) symporter